MLPSQSLVRQPDLPPGLRLRDPPYPFPTPTRPQSPDLQTAAPDRTSTPNIAWPPDRLGRLPGPFPGYEEGPFLPTSPTELVSVVVSDFYITTGGWRTIGPGEQIDYLIPNEDELTFTNNHHTLTFEATTTSNKKFRYNVLVNGIPIFSGNHNKAKGIHINFFWPILDNMTYLTVPGPGRTNTISFRAFDGKGNLTVKFVQFDYHKRLRLHTH